MGTEIVTSLTPEEQELERKQIELSTLEADLAQRELDLATLDTELRMFQNHYYAIIGARYAELDLIEARIAIIRAGLNPDDTRAQRKAERARNQAEESARAAESAPKDSEQPIRFKPSDNLKKLYRELAKRYHPDLAIDEKEKERHQRLMTEVNRAYADGDELRLQTLLRQWETSPESIKGDEVGARLVRIIRQIAQVGERLLIIEKEIRGLVDSSLYQLKCKVETAESGGQDLLAEMVLFLDQQIVKARHRLEKIIRQQSCA